MDCGPTCLRMVAKHYGRHYNTGGIRNTAGFSKEGVNLLGIAEAAEKIGFRTRGVQLTYVQLIQAATLPAILHWGQNHFVVAIPPTPKWELFKRLFKKRDIVTIADPAKGLINYTKEEFLQKWASNNNDDGEPIGTALLLEPSPAFYEQAGEPETKLQWALVLQYLRNSKWQITQVFLALLITSLLQLIAPLA